jgi:uncharacterized protein YggE
MTNQSARAATAKEWTRGMTTCLPAHFASETQSYDHQARRKAVPDWIDKAQRIWRFHGVRDESTVCVDQQGRICTIGLHFMAAERDNAYPIEVFMQRPDMLPPNAGGKPLEKSD